ncbi:hypothetical protein [Methanocella conradii]|uniref:hypothetical protein n=1 Tax=Methanocella conradii TaxID=1175444 RepID=UPI00157C5ED7|nr:hypothetical protein [Methanocella conradii]
MKIKLNRILCIPVSLMILLAVTVVPTMACSPLVPCSKENLPAAGPAYRSVVSDLNVAVQQLPGNDADAMVADVLNNDDLKVIRQELSDRKLVERTNLSKAYTATVSDSASVSKMTMVEIPYASMQDNVKASVVVLKKDGSEPIVSAVIAGNGKTMKKPMDILKTNDTYKEQYGNIVAQKYNFDDANITVTEVISNDSDIAAISAKAVNSNGDVKTIYGLVDMKKGTVIAAGNLECIVCKFVANAVLQMLIAGTFGGKITACASICSETIETVLGFVACVAICYVVVTYVLGLVTRPSAGAICYAVSYCSSPN